MKSDIFFKWLIVFSLLITKLHGFGTLPSWTRSFASFGRSKFPASGGGSFGNGNGGPGKGLQKRVSGDNDGGGPRSLILGFSTLVSLAVETRQEEGLLASSNGLYKSSYRRSTRLHGASERYRGGQGWEKKTSALGNSPATMLTIIITVAGFLMQQSDPYLLMRGAKYAPLIRRGQYYRLLTPLFLHGNMAHLFTNMFSLNNVGPAVEKLFGSRLFFVLYGLSGIGGNIASMYYGDSRAIGIGASGAVFGMTGLIAAHLLKNRRIMGTRAEAGLKSVQNTLIINAVYGYANRGIDNTAHIGGFLAGLAMGYVFGPTYGYKHRSNEIEQQNLLFTALRYPFYTLKALGRSSKRSRRRY
mmetsp:Transcript_44324/g.76592  ORF Transcript_44324/g.76592 Transcript_44324/m.76592 type:complete len:357 (+) Transcript_44324:89-1159(+)